MSSEVFSESAVFFELLRDRTDGVLVDVGAHYGTVCKQFVHAGWNVLAFEPDDAKHETLQGLVRKFPDRFALRTCALGDAPGTATFYRSEESSGIASLLPFRQSHEAVGEVQVSTLATELAAANIERIDFLKVDAEGHDIAVLRGLDWSRWKPDAVLCEFEDAKTTQYGSDHRDLANSLLEQGYAVFVSEWAPIVRYGGPHIWRRVARWPCELLDSNAWGNFFAVQPGALEAQLVELLRTHGLTE